MARIVQHIQALVTDGSLGYRLQNESRVSRTYGRGLGRVGVGYGGGLG